MVSQLPYPDLTDADADADPARWTLMFLANALARAERDLKITHQNRALAAATARREGMSHQAIGDILGVTEGGVRAMIAKHTHDRSIYREGVEAGIQIAKERGQE